ncbi:hypothetical protein AUEXF2481DRAFT_35355 [Aureobasidium subglaciale EXF-2481]|uniref:Uncharacterized protein n=1 Tax=Aureobasidium subglaciale (strain EXF-2481) TaxID=1043005 RepID=A0A074YP27_AURSE|nr:uncharacterized protein AUEXF2481DRAFT_35355 [Aureobasidium subglaciale EXF-2481]KEQ99445.1 hypothetical protein AUEXF2481DRAFT_35355 [Aureobasidium subglaciale EXF-2481]
MQFALPDHRSFSGNDPHSTGISGILSCMPLAFPKVGDSQMLLVAVSLSLLVVVFKYAVLSLEMC